MNLATAQRLAERIAAEVGEFCERVEIAGSIRRRRPNCNDVDLVVLPKPGRLLELQGRFHRSCKVVSEGVQNAMYELRNGVQVDVFFAHHEVKDIFGEVHVHRNFGSLLLCRTGSKEHNIYLIQVAKARGLIWRPYDGVYCQEDGRMLASAEEGEIFEALGIDFVAPERRER